MATVLRRDIDSEVRHRVALAATLKAAWSVWQRADGLHLAAALSFYGALSLAPFFIVVVAIANWSLGSDRATQYLLNEISDVAGAASAHLIAQLVDSHRVARMHHGLSAVIGTATLMLSATASFAELQHAFNRIFGENIGRPAWRSVVRSRVLSMVLVIGVALLAIASLAVTTRVHASLGSIAEPDTWIAFLSDELLSFVVLTLAFAALLHTLPDCPPRLGAAVRGALVSAALFCLGKFAIGWYLGRVALGSAYGAAGALVVIMFWIYCSTIVLLVGATLARALDRDKRLPSPRSMSQPTIDTTGGS
ncbi:MAG TPA: YihY/virulence factor BrkB family protein [Casimicrobiaceae bacterium]|nr:YihY/virulence factor BrkB family protein [Casimicrobiaceae bacterium]